MRAAALTARIAHLIGRLRDDCRGVGAIEFAFIAPVMIVLYIGAVEVSVAMAVNKKLARASSTVADLITQDRDINKNTLMGMEAVARSIMAPYDPQPVKMKISSVYVEADGTAIIDWSWKPNTGNGERAYIEGSETVIPDGLRVPDTYLIRAELAYRHDMITSFPFTGRTMTGIDMGKTYHLRPRMGDDVDCTNC